MTALLTPEQLAGIVKRDKHHSDPVVTSHTDRRALLRDREAICERYAKLATEYRALEFKLAKVREWCAEVLPEGDAKNELATILEGDGNGN